MIRALLVDVDGVLVRGRPGDNAHWSAELYQDLGIQFEDLSRLFFRTVWPDVIVGRRNLADGLEPLLRALSSNVTPRQLIDYWFSHDSDCDQELLAALDACRSNGLRVELATNQEHERAHYLMHTVGLKDHVDAINFSADMGCRKPDPDFFAAISNRLDLTPGELLLLDDALENVNAARDLGWHAVHWSGTRSLKDELHQAGIAITGER